MSVVLLGLQQSAPSVPQASTTASDWTLSSSRGSIGLTGAREIMEGSAVLGPAPRSAVLGGALGIDGSIANPLRPYRRSERRMTFIVHIEGDTPELRLTLMRSLLAALTPLDGTLVTASVRLPDGDQASIDGVAEFDGNSFSPRATWDTIAVVSFDLVCPDPLWRGQERSATQQAATTSVGFFPILPLTIAPSTSIGDPLVLQVGGDAISYPLHVINGPATSFSCESFRGPEWELDLAAAPLLAGETIEVDTDPRSVFTGRPRVRGPLGEDYTRYLVKRQLFALLPGTERVTYNGAGISSSTRVAIYWRPRIEAVM